MAQSIRSFKTYSVRRNQVTYIGDVYPNGDISTVFPMSKELIIGDVSYYEIRNRDNETVYITDSEGVNVIYRDLLPTPYDTYKLFPTVARFKETLNIYGKSFPYYIFTLQTRGRGDNEITYAEYRNENKEVVFVTVFYDTVSFN